MNLVALDIPNDSADWPGWLERQLVGLDLGDLVVQLETIVGERQADAPSLEELLGGSWDDVLRAGLSSLSHLQIRALLSHPRLLLELQERVLVEGGEYWSSVPIALEHQQRVADQRERIRTQIDEDITKPRSVRAEDSAGGAFRVRMALLSVFALAALLLIAIGFWFTPPAGPTWGFDRPGLLAADVPAGVYLYSLADAAGAWFSRRADRRRHLCLARLGHCPQLRHRGAGRVDHRRHQRLHSGRCGNARDARTRARQEDQGRREPAHPLALHRRYRRAVDFYRAIRGVLFALCR